MGRYELILRDQLSDEQLEDASHAGHPVLAPILGPFVERVRTLRRTIAGLDAQPDEEMPQEVLNENDPAVAAVANLVSQASALAVDDAESGSRAATLVAQLDQHERRLQRARAFIVGAVVQSVAVAADLKAKSDELWALTARAQELLNSIAGLEERIETLSGKVGAGKLEQFYGAAAARYRRLARFWLLAAGIAAIGLALAAWYVFGGLVVTSETPWQELAREFLVRATVLAALGYVVSVAVKSYRANTHLAVVCEQKKTALDTFILFLDSPANSEMVTAELVRFVFSPTDSGYLETTTERTIIEQVGSFVPSLNRPTGG